MILAVTEAPDSHRDFFSGGFRWSEGAPTALTCFFVGFRADFVTSVRVSVASAGVLTLAGLRPARPENPKGTPSAPLGYVPAQPCWCSQLLHSEVWKIDTPSVLPCAEKTVCWLQETNQEASFIKKQITSCDYFWAKKVKTDDGFHQHTWENNCRPEKK